MTKSETASVVAARASRESPEDLELRVVLCARGSPGLRRALARVAGRIAASRSWERLGFTRLGDFAVERAGALDAAAPSGVQTGANTASAAETARLFFVAEAEVAQLFRTLLAVTQRALERARKRPRGSSDEASNLTTLCAWHLLRGVQAGRLHYRSGDVFGGPISARAITS